MGLFSWIKKTFTRADDDVVTDASSTAEEQTLMVYDPVEVGPQSADQATLDAYAEPVVEVPKVEVVVEKKPRAKKPSSKKSTSKKTDAKKAPRKTTKGK